MRVLLVSELVPPVRGGLERHVQTLGAELTRQGHQVRAATLTRDPDPLGEAVHSLRGLVHTLPHEHPDRPFHPPLADPIVRSQLTRVISDFRPDVIHAHNWLAASIPRSNRPPVVVTMHDYFLVCHLRTLFRYGESLCSGPGPMKCLTCGASQIGLLRSAVLVPATAYGRRVLPADALVAVSTAVADAVRPHVESEIEVIPNFVGDEPLEQPLPDGFPDDRPFILYAGDPRSYKGIDDLLAAWTAQPVPGMTLVIASTQAPSGPAMPAVHWTSLNSGQMSRACRRATLIVLPSRWAEPCATVILEAKRAGLPVIATRVGGNPDLVRDGHDGLLVPPGDPAALGSAIRRLASDGGLRRRLADEARESLADFTVEVVARRLAALYERVAARTGADRR